MRNAFIIAGCLIAVATGCRGVSQETKLTVTGSSTIAPIVSEIAKRYEREHPNVRVDVQTGGSSRGIQDVRSGLADIGMASRALKGAETSLSSHTIARDGVAVVVHAQNPVPALDRQEVAKIYLDEINNWSSVGGSDAPVIVVNKAEGRATLEVFADYFGLDNTKVQADVVIGDNEQGVKTIAGNPNAIGYVSIGTALIDVDHGVEVRLVVVDGVEPTLESIRDGSYPIVRPLNLVTRDEPTGLTAAFIEYVKSPAATDIVEGQYFVQVRE